jgi:hypothetical protein
LIEGVDVRALGQSGQTIADQNSPLSVVTPIADKRGSGLIVCYVPKADILRIPIGDRIDLRRST